MIRGFEANTTGAAGAHARRHEAAGWMQPASWIAIGFLAGALFWHLVGFWNFVSKAVFQSDNNPVATAAKPSEPPPVQPLTVAVNTRGAKAGKASTCVVLVLDRLGGTTRQAPCPAKTFHHRNAGVGVKRDRETPRRAEPGEGLARWSTELELQASDWP